MSTTTKVTKKPHAKDGETAKERYHRLKREGLCVDGCGKKAMKDRVMCADCIAATAARAAKRAKAKK